MAHRALRGVERGDVPALAAVRQRVGLDAALHDLVLVLLVVLELDDPPLDDRGRDDARDRRVVAAGVRDLQALFHRVLAERGDDLLARGGQRALGQVLADQVDRRDQRLRLDRQQPRGAVEVVAVGLRVDLDLALLLLDLRVQHVGAAAEVDDVQHVHVLAQLLLGELQPLADLGDLHPAQPSRARSSGLVRAARAAGLDQDARERHQPREALRADRRVAGAARRGAVAPARRGPVCPHPRGGSVAPAAPARGGAGRRMGAARPCRCPAAARGAPSSGGVSPWRSSSSSTRRPSSAVSSSGPSSRACAPSPSTHEIRLRGLE